MNFTHLFAFREVARAGSISAGAERLRVSQPAVTREIRELEERIGLVLFDRLPRGVALTEAGRLLFGHAEKIFTLADIAESQLNELAGLDAGHLHIGASATLGVYLVPELIARFSDSHPKVTIDLTVTNTESVEAGLRELKFAVGFVEGPFDASVLHACPIGQDEIAVIAASDHPLIDTRLQATDLVDKAVVMREPGSGTRAIVEDAYANRGLSIQPLMSVSDTEAIKRMLRVSRTLAYLSVLSVRDELARDELRAIEVESMRIDRQLHMVWLKERTLSPSARAFTEFAALRHACVEAAL
ncbi:LysR substrate-binding domain-containing protein [Paraburkholderia sp.]|uniref:LysR substrate-binding domain-containing protein n=1 Tax=Paraburkholderia sp. TaxID=1926495 RepID=UPI0039E2584D